MNIIQTIQHEFNAYLQQFFELSPDIVEKTSLTLNVDENRQEFGDLNSNAAMVLAKELKKSPLQLAELIAGGFTNEHIKQIAVHPPGFINIFLTEQALQALAQEMHTEKKNFLKLAQPSDQHINIEFVSANPTGPLHVGHGRGAIIGDVLANVFAIAGIKAAKEFYINDAGKQMELLGISFKGRCLQALGQEASIPEKGYHGEYLVDLAQELIKKEGTSVVEKSTQFFTEYAQQHLLQNIRETLADYGVTFDVWFSEKTLHTNAIQEALATLKQHGHVYEQDGATWLASTAFGDDKDRVLIKADGTYTYALADVAYMQNKFNRGFNHLIMILGHDHHSYQMRLKCIEQALGHTEPLDVILYQLVKMKQSGQQVRMSKRAGSIVTLKDVIETVGKDVARFFFLHRKADAQLEFDLDLALKTTDENPVYYAQYAYVRTKSILEKAAAHGFASIGPKDAQYIEQDAALLIKKMATLCDIIANICTTHQTHQLTYYLLELAHLFHSYYAKHRIVDTDAPDTSRGRLLVISLLKETFETVLGLLGISLPERM